MLEAHDPSARGNAARVEGLRAEGRGAAGEPPSDGADRGAPPAEVRVARHEAPDELPRAPAGCDARRDVPGACPEEVVVGMEADPVEPAALPDRGGGRGRARREGAQRQEDEQRNRDELHPMGVCPDAMHQVNVR